MNYKGVIIEESLKDKSVLEDVNVLKTDVEQVRVEHKTPWLKQWTLHTVEIEEDKGDVFAEKLSQDIVDNPSSWYADYKNDKIHFIVFPNKIFKVNLANPVLYKDARAHGISFGIPEYQVNFKPEN